ncbi:MAG: glycosyltransferase [Chlorobiales bacterium]|nr:glycosyltransferase [Chlorobiales bacterium]
MKKNIGMRLQNKHLIVIPSVPVWRNDNILSFDRKFYDGMVLYTQKWPGIISCIISTSRSSFSDFGVISKTKEELPFKCTVLDFDETVTVDHLTGASIVFASADANNQLYISDLCRKSKIKCVYAIEYIPETRYQITLLTTHNPFVILRRFIYIWQQEKKRISAFSISDGIQSNGTPAYYEYKKFKNKLLYFDTRVYKANFITDNELEYRLKELSTNKPLRLAFSGRLIRMKGADHLVKLALLLKQRKVPYKFYMYGAGELKDEMIAYIQKHQLEDNVFLPGPVDFYNQLLPDLKKNIDLFICLHRQSDPSCTYLETLSCGVPIVGYKNKAFSGLLSLADIGWGAEINDLKKIADTIERLNENRTQLFAKSRSAVEFARPNDFETTFQNRINHLLSILES